MYSDVNGRCTCARVQIITKDFYAVVHGNRFGRRESSVAGTRLEGSMGQPVEDVRTSVQVLCCAVLCCAVLCCAVRCCAVLCCFNHAIPPTRQTARHCSPTLLSRLHCLPALCVCLRFSRASLSILHGVDLLTRNQTFFAEGMFLTRDVFLLMF